MKSVESIFHFNICEFLGAMFLVIAAISPMILFIEIFKSGIAVAVVADALAVGFILFALIEIFNPICTSYFNPAVTLAFAIVKKISWHQAFSYCTSQFLGGLSGLIITHLMFFHEIPKIISISGINRSGGTYIAEIIGTFILVLTIFSLSYQKSNRVSLVIGLLIGGMVLATSSTMFANPQVTIARIFTYSEAGISILDGVLFVIMEIIGMVLAIFTWKKVEKSCNFIYGKI
jgi:glycerol uptake facilitator-like aquaporin